ncbi:MAG: MerR family transcriptional regulator [Planctomycetes bacterium]|nr:MerR family transcriptional regulator [Planctomycetota bacterium]
MTNPVLVAPTIGEIARRLGVPVHRVEYVIRTRNLRPVARAGNLRVFSEADVAYVAGELRRMDTDRAGGPR